MVCHEVELEKAQRTFWGFKLSGQIKRGLQKKEWGKVLSFKNNKKILVNLIIGFKKNT